MERRGVQEAQALVWDFVEIVPELPRLFAPAHAVIVAPLRLENDLWRIRLDIELGSPLKAVDQSKALGDVAIRDFDGQLMSVTEYMDDRVTLLGSSGFFTLNSPSRVASSPRSILA